VISNHRTAWIQYVGTLIRLSTQTKLHTSLPHHKEAVPLYYNGTRNVGQAIDPYVR